MTRAFPLEWPDSWRRVRNRHKARYTVETSKAIRELYRELSRMGATSVVISSNVPVRNDGQMYRDAANKRYDDPGVAVYFQWGKDPWVVACDHWDRVKANIRAVGLTIEALRSIERAGASELMRRAFLGFKALPAVGETSRERHWTEILGLDDNADKAEIEDSFKALARAHHPDTGGDGGAMVELNRARREALATL